TCHPVKRRPVFSLGITLVVLFIIAAVYNTTQSAFFGFLAFVIMFVSLAKFYLPTRFRLSDKGVTVKTTTQTLTKNWSDYRSFYPDKNGILLSPFATPARLENFRGLYVMFNNNSEEVTAFVKAHINTPVESSSGEKT
ncbi:MAG: hypothetical protein ACREBV_09965, partial [Candidatus Zixiibacteriota bacterium]